MRQETILRKVLSDNRAKLTQPRLFVFRLLLDHGPQSLAELTARSAGNVDRVSVYRIVALFERVGILKKVTIGWKYKVELSEIFLDHHHHITCLSCGTVTAVKENEAIETILHTLANGTGFVVASHQLELQGYCQKCQKRLYSEQP